MSREINYLGLLAENLVFAASALAQGKEDEELCVFSDSIDSAVSAKLMAGSCWHQSWHQQPLTQAPESEC